MQITKNVHALKIPFTIPLPNGGALERFVYSYFILSDRVYLVDSGVAGAETSIFGYLGEIGRAPSEIATLFLTHAHPDHLGAAKTIQESTGCTVAAHPADAGWVTDTAGLLRDRPVPGLDKLISGPVPVDILLEDGDTLTLGSELRLKVIHTPGHSPGSLSFYLEEQGILISGDAVPRPGDMPIYDDYPASCASLEKLGMIGRIDTLLSSWDDPRHGQEAKEAIPLGLAYLRKINAAVQECRIKTNENDLKLLCSCVLQQLQLQGVAPNPLLIRTMQAHLQP